MKKIFNSRALALILVLAMAVSLFTLSVSAATSESLSGHGSNISSIVVTGADFESVEYATSTDIHGTANKFAAGVGRTSAPTMKYGTSESAMRTTVTAEASGSVFSRTVAAGTYYINATGTAENLYINGSKVESGAAYSFTVKSGETTTLRIIAQDDTQQPFIKLVSLTGR